jgi:hypothetical protein
MTPVESSFAGLCEIAGEATVARMLSSEFKLRSSR